MENPYIRYPQETFPERLLKLALLFEKIRHLDDETVKVIMADPSLLKTEHLIPIQIMFATHKLFVRV